MKGDCLRGEEIKKEDILYGENSCGEDACLL